MYQVLLQYNRFFFNHTFPSAEQSTAKKLGARNQKMEDEAIFKSPASVADTFLHGIVNMVHEMTWKVYAKMFKLHHSVIRSYGNLKVPITG